VARADIEAEIQRLGLQQRVLLAGVVSPVAPLYRRADLLLMPSTRTAGHVADRGAGLALPGAASNTGGIPKR
jgi:glycosyltransferase involved in cell wall biosynthesis